MRKYVVISFIFMIAALVGGVFYREFTKFYNFTGYSPLSVVHVHLFILGVIFTLVVGMLDVKYKLSENKCFRWFLLTFIIALPFMTSMMITRGIMVVMNLSLSKGLDAAISGIAGLSHTLMAVSLILLFVSMFKEIKV